MSGVSSRKDTRKAKKIGAKATAKANDPGDTGDGTQLSHDPSGNHGSSPNTQPSATTHTNASLPVRQSAAGLASGSASLKHNSRQVGYQSPSKATTGQRNTPTNASTVSPASRSPPMNGSQAQAVISNKSASEVSGPAVVRASPTRNSLQQNKPIQNASKPSSGVMAWSTVAGTSTASKSESGVAPMPTKPQSTPVTKTNFKPGQLVASSIPSLNWTNLVNSGTLATNHFEIKISSQNFRLYQYNVTFDRVLHREEIEKRNANQQRRNQQSTDTANPPDAEAEGAGDSPGVKLPGRATQRRLMYLLTKELSHSATKPGITIASDYEHILITNTPFPSNDLAKGVNVVLTGPHQTVAAEYPHFRANIVEANPFELAPSSILADDTTAPPSDSLRKSIIRALNIVFSHRPNSRTFTDLVTRAPNHSHTVQQVYSLVGRNKFFHIASPPRQLGPKTVAGEVQDFEVFNGFFLSTKAPVSEQRLLLNIGTKTSAFYPAINLATFLNQLQTSGYNRVRATKVLRGLRVQTTYLNASPRASRRKEERLYAISGLWPEKAGKYKVTFKEKQVDLSTYFGEAHKATVSPTNLLMKVLHGKDTRIPACLLTILPGQILRHKADLLKESSRLPASNKDLIETHGKAMFGLNDSSVSSNPSLFTLFQGLDIDQSMLHVPARILKHPTLAWQKPKSALGTAQSFLPNDKPAEGSWDLRNRHFWQPSRKGWFTYLYIGKVNAPENLQNFAETLRKTLSSYGLAATLHEHQERSLHKLNPTNDTNASDEDNLQNALRDRLTTITETYKPSDGPVPVVFIVLDRRDTTVYSAIKRICERELGILTICHVCKEVKDRGVLQPWGAVTQPQFIGNLLMKYNLKAGRQTVNQVLQKKSNLLDSGTMLMGIDVTHAGAAARAGAPSIAAVVGSINAEFSQYPAVLAPNPREEVNKDAIGRAQEKIVNLASMVEKSVKYWSANNGGHLPRRLIVFRDGLSEEQFQTVAAGHELNEIRAGLRRLILSRQPVAGSTTTTKPQKQPDVPPKILLICTVKRHHTRFFDTGGQKTTGNSSMVDKNGNPMPGTVISSDVVLGDTAEGRHDFFLVSHRTLQGTCKATHYVTLLNEMEATLPQVAEMTHSLCYLFGRSTTSVSLAPPAYYADLAADRARLYVNDVYNPADDGKYEETMTMDLDLKDRVAQSMFYI